MSLADELLADLEDDDAPDDAEVDAAHDDDADMIEDVEDKIEISADSIRSIAKLRDSEQLHRIVNDIEKYKDSKERVVVGPVEMCPEYQLIVEANNITIEIDNEINIIHKFARDHYQKRFPELESLVATPVEYIKTVRELGNDISIKSKNNDVLSDTLTPATVMVVSVTASTTQGTVLNDEELARINEACNMALELLEIKTMIFRYVESRMSFIAPNLSIIVGASTAAKLMGLAGGLTALSKMPACNVMILGNQKRGLGGFHSAQQQPHMGFIYHSEIVQKTPPDLRKKAVRLVAAKCTLAARVDSFHESQDGRTGDVMLAEIDQKLDKLQEPPPVKAIKPLPAPIDEARKKRGGRRARKMKERLGMSEMRKQANRMNFGAIEDDAYQDDLGFSKGNLGKGGTGKIRGPVVDSKTKARISKTLQQKVQKQTQGAIWGGSTTVRKQISGTASSVAFTPLQGLEIVNPQAAETRVQEANQKYFSATSSFINVSKGKT